MNVPVLQGWSTQALLRFQNVLAVLMFLFGGIVGIAISGGPAIIQLQIASTFLFYATAVVLLALVATGFIVLGHVGAEVARRLTSENPQ